MKHLSYFIILLLLIMPAAVHAQEIDHERMSRDLDIMESILEELFKIEPAGDDIAIIREALHGNSGAEGTYLPGYGVLFRITPPAASQVFFSFAKEDHPRKQGNVAYFAGGDDGGQAMDAETIKKRIIEFLRDYGSTIDQLKSSDHIMVMFAGDGEQGFVQYFSFGQGHTSTRNSGLPVVSIVVQKSVLDAYDNGALSEEAFEQQLSISVDEKTDEPSTDLKIMAGILEAAFEDQGEEMYQITGAVRYQRVENFGALFSFDINYGNIYQALSLRMAHLAPLEDIDIDIDFDSTDWDSIDIKGFDSDAFQKKMKQVQVRVKHVQKQLDQRQQAREETRAERTAKMKEALDDFLTSLKEYIIDYGGTLGSVPSEQQLFFSITIENATAEIPDQIQLLIEKSVLEAVEEGQISKEEAMEEIVVDRGQ